MSPRANDERADDEKKLYSAKDIEDIVDKIIKKKEEARKKKSKEKTSSSSSSSNSDSDITSGASASPPKELLPTAKETSPELSPGCGSPSRKRAWKDTTSRSSPPRRGRPEEQKNTQDKRSLGEACGLGQGTSTGRTGRRWDSERRRLALKVMRSKYPSLSNYIREHTPDHGPCCNQFNKIPCPFFNSGRCYQQADHFSSSKERAISKKIELFGHFCKICYDIVGIQSAHSQSCPTCPMRSMTAWVNFLNSTQLIYYLLYIFLLLHYITSY